jgi:hypothetical protein
VKQVLSREEVLALLQGMAAAEPEDRPGRVRLGRKRRGPQGPPGGKGPRVRFRKHLVVSLR